MTLVHSLIIFRYSLKIPPQVLYRYIKLKEELDKLLCKQHQTTCLISKVGRRIPKTGPFCPKSTLTPGLSSSTIADIILRRAMLFCWSFILVTPHGLQEHSCLFFICLWIIIFLPGSALQKLIFERTDTQGMCLESNLVDLTTCLLVAEK